MFGMKKFVEMRNNSIGIKICLFLIYSSIIPVGALSKFRGLKFVTLLSLEGCTFTTLGVRNSLEFHDFGERNDQGFKNLVP